MAIIDYEDEIFNIVKESKHSNFIFDFLSVYKKIPRSTITKLKRGNNNLSNIHGEVYLKNKLYFKEVKKNLLQSYINLNNKINTLRSRPRFIFVTNYKNILAKDIKTNDTLDIKFIDLPKYFEFFLPWDGIEKADLKRESPADLKAAERFAKLYDIVVKDNKNNSNVSKHGLNNFLIRLLFCLFAEDTGIFNKNLFTNTIKNMTSVDGSDFNDIISQLFAFLDKKNRTNYEPAWLTHFPYVNGQLFTEKQESMIFTYKSRKSIIDAGELIGWERVNPDILGSMLQAVASEDNRGHLGMHYTSVPNIMKVIKPLFLDDLEKEFQQAKGNLNKLNKLLNRISKIKFMDPACGSGNFLIITYKKLRELEIKILKEQVKINPSIFYVPAVDLSQFYGIEIDDFAVDVTRLSLWIADHQMNKKLEHEFGDVVRPTLPLHKAGDIKCANALKVDWNQFIPHKKDDEVYLFGNPPYLGAKKQTKNQKEDIKRLIRPVVKKKYKKLDYIVCWFYLASEFVKNINGKFAFVTTNSINQGEQVSIVWPALLKRIQIIFAYKSFDWNNNAKNNAGVTVSIIGCSNLYKREKCKLLFTNNTVKIVNSINPYLTDGNNTIVYAENYPINGLPNIFFGNMPRDNGNLILNKNEYNTLLEELPNNIGHKILRKYIGSKEFVNNQVRYCLWMNKSDFYQVKNNTIVYNKVKNVKEFRQNRRSSTGNETSTTKASKTPWSFVQKGEYIKHFNNKNPKSYNSIIIPRLSTSSRIYIPMGIINSNIIVSDLAMVIYNANLWLLGLLQSKMHMIWFRNFGGRFRTGYRYSASLVYNTFPVPNLSTRRKNQITNAIVNILDIRNEESGTLADLYGSPLAKKKPKAMNQRLLQAHKELDAIVDRAYNPKGFNNDHSRLTCLLNMYDDMKKGD